VPELWVLPWVNFMEPALISEIRYEGTTQPTEERGTQLSTRVLATARLTATRRRELNEQFRLSVDPTVELSRLSSIIGSRQLTLADLRQLISAPGASSVLSTLAPAEFSRLRARTEDGSRSALETTAADLQAELAETLAVVATAIRAMTRDITANTIAKCGLKLGYAVAAHHAETATCVRLCRGNETVLVRIHDGGDLEFDHNSGLSGDACGEHQLWLERAAKSCGVLIAQRP